MGNFVHIFQGYFTGIGPIVRLPLRQRNKTLNDMGVRYHSHNETKKPKRVRV